HNQLPSHLLELHGVHAHFLGHEPHTVAVLAHGHNFGFGHPAAGAGHVALMSLLLISGLDPG
ncbi:hypothetical protein, partial [Citrobacter youngae]|uniref:hypothetical protein n=1 Tax=Citrobacter youngae TaxID=133448 RepID=UPI001954DFBC